MTALSPESYFSFLITMLIIFGVAFELPLLLIMLNSAGVLTGERLARSRRYAIFGLVVFAGLVVPGNDSVTMGALAVALVAARRGGGRAGGHRRPVRPGDRRTAPPARRTAGPRRSVGAARAAPQKLFASRPGEHDQLLGGPGHGDVPVDGTLDAAGDFAAERVRVDQYDQIELQPLDQLRAQ